MKFVDIKNNIAFAKIFGDSHKKEILISFLNALLGLDKDKKITDLTFNNIYQLSELEELNNVPIVIKVTDQQHRVYIVTMQTNQSSSSFELQILDNVTRFGAAVFVGILNFCHTKEDCYFSKYLTSVTNPDSLDKYEAEINLVELPKFYKKFKAQKNLVEKWLYFIKNATNLTVIPEDVDTIELQMAYESADNQSWNAEELVLL